MIFYFTPATWIQSFFRIKTIFSNIVCFLVKSKTALLTGLIGFAIHYHYLSICYIYLYTINKSFDI